MNSAKPSTGMGCGQPCTGIVSDGRRIARRLRGLRPLKGPCKMNTGRRGAPFLPHCLAASPPPS